MPDPAQLPSELFQQILCEVFDGQLDDWRRCSAIPGDACLVSRRWNGFISPLLYSRFEFDGKAEHLRSLWAFFRTIILNPDLAAHVRHLTFTVQHAPAQPPPSTSLYLENKAIILQAMKQAGLAEDAELDSEAHVALQQGDYRPLTALILAHVPRLIKLQMHLVRVDPFLDAILAHALHLSGSVNGAPQAVAFQSLRSLYLASAGTESPSTRRLYIQPRVLYPVRMDRTRPFHRLPNLQELLVLDALLDDDLAAVPPAENDITQLTLAFVSPIRSVRPVLRCFARLTQLSLSLGITSERVDMAEHQDLWEAILPFRNQLQYLDLHGPEIYQDAQGVSRWLKLPSETDSRLSFCCPLHQFTRLRQLCITPLLLAGHRCPHEPPTKIISHLPPALESLVLYCGYKAWLATHIEQLDEELLEIPEHKPLNSILIHPAWRGDWERSLCYTRLMEGCDRNRIMFTNTRGKDEFVFSGGRSTPFAQTRDRSITPDILARLRREKKASDIIPRRLEVQTFRGTLDENWMQIGSPSSGKEEVSFAADEVLWS